jgi:hypothetical protein
MGAVSMFQEAQCKELRSKELLHQYLAIMDIKVLQTFFVNLKQLKPYVGVA